MFFGLMLLLVPAGLGWALAWTIRHRRLPATVSLWAAVFGDDPAVTRDGTPFAYWGAVLGLSFAILLSASLAGMLLLSG